ncbi:MAG: SBBP repeat-containing protein [Acidobacteria bacterium]|nr:SBBP repeat-containing protein [Acidobacteriota bacterium]
MKFLASGGGHTLFLNSTEAVLVLSRIEQNEDAREIKTWRLDSPKAKYQDLQSSVVRMKLLGTNRKPRVQGTDPLPGKVNYFVGNDPKNWRADIPTYGKVEYRDVYSGVDLVYYGNQRQLEYDFVVTPGADPKAIQLAFEGADKIEVDAQGDLIVHTACGEPCRTTGGEVRLLKPLIYQEINGVKQPIPGGYVLLDLAAQDSRLETADLKLRTHTVGFQVASYDSSQTLVIDPVLVYSTYLGGSDYDLGSDIAVDSFGNAYLTGQTSSTNFPTTPGAFQPAFAGGSFGQGDAFVTKVNAAGSALVYSTYLGGSDKEEGTNLAVDCSGNAYVAGYTTSSPSSSIPFPTVNPMQPANAGGDDGFVTKFNAAGSALVYSTYLGGSAEDLGRSIAVDSSSNAYVTGYSSSTNFPTVSPLQATYAGGAFDAFVVKITDQLCFGVVIGIKPGSFPNSINLGSGGTVPIAIFSTTTFNARTIDPITVTLASAPVKLRGQGTPMTSIQDVNGDGLLDLVVHVSTEALQLAETDTQATLQGTTADGSCITGVDTVRVVP